MTDTETREIKMSMLAWYALDVLYSKYLTDGIIDDDTYVSNSEVAEMCIMDAYHAFVNRSEEPFEGVD